MLCCRNPALKTELPILMNFTGAKRQIPSTMHSICWHVIFPCVFKFSHIFNLCY